MYFTITTNREVADKIKKDFDSGRNNHRSMVLGDIRHESEYSVVQIKAKEEKINPTDIFWLGYHLR